MKEEYLNKAVENISNFSLSELNRERNSFSTSIDYEIEKQPNILNNYYLLPLEYNYVTGLRIKIDELYNNYAEFIERIKEYYIDDTLKEKIINNIKEIYFSIINRQLTFTNKTEIYDLSKNYKGIELIDFLKELIEFNIKYQTDNEKAKKALEIASKHVEYNGTNIYKTIYGDNNE